MAFRNQVSSFVQSLPDNLWEIHPMNQLAWLKYFKDLKPDHGFLSWLVRHFNPNTMVFRFGDSDVTSTYEEMCATMGHHPEQDETPALPPGPRCDLTEVAGLCPVYLPSSSFLFPVAEHVCYEKSPTWNWRFLTADRRPGHAGVSSYRLHDDHGRDHVLVPTRSILTYGLANFHTRSRGHFDFGDNPMIRWTCPWWRIRLVTAGSMNLNYVLYASLDCSMAYFPDRINRQYGVVQHIPRVHNFESGPMMQSLLTNLADRWRNRDTWYMGQGAMHDTVTPEYVDWFYSQ
ncbi:hypothetical protein JCGZ_15438 [Jatropha curcas]|uniref:Aminotransferase-like plant mobile domain-containing protein n=1 Tax=Jatropha curcas TaxID=180498 RepID=A0A067K5T3_JATCU|nr:hypothetical protein JCGZ_15438 [Jatropha curcas]